MRVWILVLVALIGGCDRFIDGYQFGDVTLTAVDVYQRIATVQGWYCAATSPDEREKAISIMDGMGINYGEEGFCGLTVAAIIDRRRNADTSE